MASKYPRLPLNKLSYEEIKIGDQFFFERLVDKDLVQNFVDISGDYNPLHIDEAYAKKTKFGDPIAHGMLMGSFFSALVGMLCPGLHCLYLSQTAHFRKPLKINSMVIITGEVVDKSDATKILTIETIVKDKRDTIIVDGIAKVKVGYE